MLKIIFFPFFLCWKLVGFLFGIMGRLLSLIIGLALILAGGAATLTVVGAIVGIPLLIVGVLLFFKSFLW